MKTNITVTTLNKENLKPFISDKETFEMIIQKFDNMESHKFLVKVVVIKKLYGTRTFTFYNLLSLSEN
jgi:hypothetical protein